MGAVATQLRKRDDQFVLGRADRIGLDDVARGMRRLVRLPVFSHGTRLHVIGEHAATSGKSNKQADRSKLFPGADIAGKGVQRVLITRVFRFPAHRDLLDKRLV
jgi:hypothetical protein